MTVAGYDRDRLETALREINEVRTLPSGAPGRLEGLIEGLEGILAAEAADGEREGEGARALGELEGLLSGVDSEADASSVREFLEPIVDRLIDGLLDRPDNRLASYGSLQPGEANHHHVADLIGRWSPATVRGMFHPDGGEATRSFPGVTWTPGGEPVPVQIFECTALPGHWQRLDEFEGPGYRRALVTADADDGWVVVNLYEIAEPPAA